MGVREEIYGFAASTPPFVWVSEHSYLFIFLFVDTALMVLHNSATTFTSTLVENKTKSFPLIFIFFQEQFPPTP